MSQWKISLEKIKMWMKEIDFALEEKKIDFMFSIEWERVLMKATVNWLRYLFHQNRFNFIFNTVKIRDNRYLDMHYAKSHARIKLFFLRLHKWKIDIEMCRMEKSLRIGIAWSNANLEKQFICIFFYSSKLFANITLSQT